MLGLACVFFFDFLGVLRGRCEWLFCFLFGYGEIDVRGVLSLVNFKVRFRNFEV